MAQPPQQHRHAEHDRALRPIVQSEIQSEMRESRSAPGESWGPRVWRGSPLSRRTSKRCRIRV